MAAREIIDDPVALDSQALADALEQQAATAEILRIISRSPADAQPVFEAIVNAGVRLFKGAAVAISRPTDGGVVPLAIAEDDPVRAARWRNVFPFPLSREYIHGAAILDCRVVDVPDVLVTGGQFEAGKRNLAPSGYRAMTVVPLVRDGAAIGALAVVRMTPGSLSAKQIALLKTFADQAVIAIENVRLFNETQEALAHQTATSDVLQVISGSMADARPVFEKILDSCEHLFSATDLGVFLVDGQSRLDVAAFRGSFADWVPGAYPRPLAGTMSEMVMRRGALMHWSDVAQAPDIPDYIRAVVRKEGNFAVAVAPLIWQGQGIGTIDVMRKPPLAYSEKELALLATFADQAVIAIQNARRFNETQDALARQTATADVLRVISASVTDTQPVFDVIAERASRLTGANSGWVFTFDGEWIHGASAFGLTPEALALALSFFPMRPGGGSYTARAICDGVVVNVADALAETDPAYATKPVARAAGYRSVLSVPMLRAGHVIGAISVNRAEVGRFADKEVELLQTFADQAVIAIENVRLFNETQHLLADAEQRNAELAVINRIQEGIAGSMEFDAIAGLVGDKLREVFDIRSIGVRWFDHESGHVHFLYQNERGRLLQSPPRPIEGPLARLATATQPLVAHTTEEIAALGFDAAPPDSDAARSLALIPIVGDGRTLGFLSLADHERERVFDETSVRLLQTVAASMSVALDNARLFGKLQGKTRELEIASRHKSAFLANMSHELRTPLNAILGFTRIVLRETRSAIAPRQAENLEKILASARHLVGLINATLDLTRIEAGRIELTASDIALAPLLEECLRSVEPLCTDGVRLRSRIATDVAPMHVDAAKLHQILINLLGNAVKFTERGWIELRAAQRDERVVVEVEDTGIGVPADKLEAVFEEFEQVDASHTRAQGGTGLGLAIARRLARAMGGELAARSALGAGSTFTLTLPLRWSDDEG